MTDSDGRSGGPLYSDRLRPGGGPREPRAADTHRMSGRRRDIISGRSRIRSHPGQRASCSPRSEGQCSQSRGGNKPRSQIFPFPHWLRRLRNALSPPCPGLLRSTAPVTKRLSQRTVPFHASRNSPDLGLFPRPFPTVASLPKHHDGRLEEEQWNNILIHVRTSKQQGNTGIRSTRTEPAAGLTDRLLTTASL